MNKQTAIKKAGGVRQLAGLLKISTQAIYKWPDKVPPKKLDDLRTLRPEWFSRRSVRKLAS